MASMVAAVRDSREEMDETAMAAMSPQRTDAKAKFLIRTLPKECNPTPMAVQFTTSPVGGGVSSSGMVASPRVRKMSGCHDSETVSVEITETENPFDDITEEKLQKLTGKSDLARVTSLQIAVDSGKQSVEVIGELLPSLQQLKLSAGSTLHSFRDLGTSLHSLRMLHATQCEISDLDGISALTALQNLNLPHNAISDISPLSMHDDLQVVDLEANLIADVGQIEQLAFCPQLNELVLRGNPICRLQHYRQIVANLLPQLSVLDNVAITDNERLKLADEQIDAAVETLRTELDAEASAKMAEPSIHSARPCSSHGRRYDESTAGLSRPASSTRVGILGSEAAPPQDTTRDDYGSTLTHGTSIVFAGNVTSSLRRHRSESEGGGEVLSTASLVDGLASDWLKDLPQERPKTPAYESITATLDRAHELEKHKSRDPNMNELKAWRLETAGASVVGVVPMEEHEMTSPATSPSKRPRSSSGRSTAAERRPNTSAGVLRNGASVREAFVESQSKVSSKTSKSRAVDVPMIKRRSGSSIPTSSVAVPTSSSRNVDILVLDEEPQHDDQHPCSPRKTSRGVFTTSTRAGGDWNLEEIAPKLDLESTQSFLQRSSSRKFVGGGSDDADQDGDSASSDSSDTEDMRKMARQLKQRKPTSKPPTHSKPKGFFNVAESLHAIDRWREQMDDDSTSVESTSTLKSSQRTVWSKPREEAATVSSASDATTSMACQSSDEQIVQWMKAKHANVADIKTREGFRRFFKGIDEPRLARILHQVFSDDEKVRRRLQLMQGFFSGQAS